MGEKLTYASWQDDRAETLGKEFGESMDVLKWAFSEYGEDVMYACSFGAEGMVLIDMISKVNPAAHVLFLDTDLHFKETYELIDRVKERYPDLNIELTKPDLTLEEQEAQYGKELWKSDPNQCCRLRKIEPLHASIKGKQAWISGLRREQSPLRKNTNFLNRDDKFQSIKICPLIHWTWKEVWLYINLHKLDYNILHDRGYPSIGCAKCTRPAADPGDSRSGRWADTGKTECGLHTSS